MDGENDNLEYSMPVFPNLTLRSSSLRRSIKFLASSEFLFDKRPLFSCTTVSNSPYPL